VTAPALTIEPGHPAIRAASAALSAVYPDQEVLLACIGGLSFFSTSDENLHAPNEFLRIARLREGMRAWETLWRRLAAEGTLR
jgi:acetylornithine deacetylase/succinyl-diaminopimelate desuccinylase-like protein